MIFQNKKNSAPVPKIPNFITDGFGRDNYINSNNGGFYFKEKIPNKEKFKIPSIYKYFNTQLNTAPLKYRSDGTGRDYYVLHEHGGLEKDHLSLKNFKLKTFLRQEGSDKFNFSNDPLREGIKEKTLY